MRLPTRRQTGALLLWLLDLAAGLGGVALARTGRASAVPPPAFSPVYTYTSSVDGMVLSYTEYLPSGYNPAVPAPLAVLLPGSGGNLYNYDGTDWHSAADNHGMILITPQPRQLPGYPGNRAGFYINGALVPGEQDVLDALAAEQVRHLIDPNRRYIGGYSMGGAGAFSLAALHPGLFAAAAPGTSISDYFQERGYSPSAPPPNFATLFGGLYGQSPVTDTLWYENSARFLLLNLMNTPVRILHGTQDTVIPNATTIWPYMESRHVVDTPGFTDSRGRATTLQELRAAWPSGYYEEHIWPNADHGGASLLYLPEEVLTFFAAHTAITNPQSLGFTTYENRHTRAYWLQLALTAPDTARPGLVYATRAPASNLVALQISGSVTITLDMGPMGLTSGPPLTVMIVPTGGPPAGDLALVLAGTWPVGAGWVYTVTQDGVALPPNAYTTEATRFTLLRRVTDATHSYVIRVGQGGTPTPGPSPTLAPATFSPTPTLTPPPPCGLAWRVVSSPNPGTGDHHLRGVAALAANDAWAVGDYWDGSATQTLIQHWNGASWSVVASPSSGTSGLTAVAAVATNDIWAVGSYYTGNGWQALSEHWNGTSWSIVPSPNRGTGDNQLWGVAARAANDIWAVGKAAGITLTEHWNGSSWSIVSSPNVGLINELWGVAAVAANDVWAVGDFWDGNIYQTLTEHWNGSSWNAVASPNFGTRDNQLNSVTAVADDDVWAVGLAYLSQTLIEHWNGLTWSIVPGPSRGSLNAVAAIAANDLWAVGQSSTGSTLILHGDGTIWSPIPSPNQGTGNNDLWGVVGGNTDVWAVGNYFDYGFGHERTLVEHYSDPCLTPSPTATHPVPSPTRTPMRTATACPVQFTDVLLGSPFYAYVRCLACRGIVAGYSSSPPCAGGATPCYQPGATVTRGQMSKFIANAAGYADTIPSTRQTFTDVGYGSPFWLYVERAVLHGVISGYNSSPPCLAVPCFLPGNAVTRGQAAKFVANAAGYSEPIPPGQQTFGDVPPGDPFWVYIERVYLHGVISGYGCDGLTVNPCTGAVETCPGLYYRACAPVTRGQTAKVIANAFFPGCQTPQH